MNSNIVECLRTGLSPVRIRPKARPRTASPRLGGTEDAVRLGSIGSGDADQTDVGGDANVDSIGSGDLGVERTRGRLTVGDIGSDSVDHQDVTGSVKLPRKR